MIRVISRETRYYWLLCMTNWRQEIIDDVKNWLFPIKLISTCSCQITLEVGNFLLLLKYKNKHLKMSLRQSTACLPYKIDKNFTINLTNAEPDNKYCLYQLVFYIRVYIEILRFLDHDFQNIESLAKSPDLERKVD